MSCHVISLSGAKQLSETWLHFRFIISFRRDQVASLSLPLSLSLSHSFSVWLIGGLHRLAPPSRLQPLALHMIGPPPAAAATRGASSHKPRQTALTFPITSRRSSRSLLGTFACDLWHTTSRYVGGRRLMSVFSFLPSFLCHTAGFNIWRCGGWRAHDRNHHFGGYFFLSLQPASRSLSVLGLIKQLSLLLWRHIAFCFLSAKCVCVC